MLKYAYELLTLDTFMKLPGDLQVMIKLLCSCGELKYTSGEPCLLSWVTMSVNVAQIYIKVKKEVDLKGSIANLKDRLARVKQKQQQRLEQLQALRDMYKAKAQGNSSEPETLVIENQAQQVDELTVEASTIAEENPDVSTFEN